MKAKRKNTARDKEREIKIEALRKPYKPMKKNKINLLLYHKINSHNELSKNGKQSTCITLDNYFLKLKM